MNVDQEASYSILKHDLSRFLPIRVVIRKDENGKYLGLIENSFSMDLSDSRVRIWWSGKAYSFLGEHNLSGIEDAEHNSRPGDLIIDPFSEDSPIEIDWAAWRSATVKFAQRNAPFRVKGVL